MSQRRAKRQRRQRTCTHVHEEQLLFWVAYSRDVFGFWSAEVADDGEQMENVVRQFEGFAVLAEIYNAVLDHIDVEWAAKGYDTVSMHALAKGSRDHEFELQVAREARRSRYELAVDLVL